MSEIRITEADIDYFKSKVQTPDRYDMAWNRMRDGILQGVITVGMTTTEALKAIKKYINRGIPYSYNSLTAYNAFEYFANMMKNRLGL